MPELIPNPILPPEIIDAGLNGELVFFIGSGISQLCGLPSWKGLAYLLLDDLCSNNYLNHSEVEQLKRLDPKKIISIAELIANEKSYKLDYKKYLKKSNDKSKIFDFINNIGCSCVTTNYDLLLSPLKNSNENLGGNIIQSIEIHRKTFEEEIFAEHLNEPGTVIHLHGEINKPKGMITSTKKYLEHYDKKEVKYFLSELFAQKVVLFLGYGLEESEILEHILRRSNVEKNLDKRRFALNGFFLSEQPLFDKLYEYYLNSFGVHLIGFVRDFNNWNQLEEIMSNWSHTLNIKPTPLAKDLDFMESVLNDPEIK